MGQAPALKRKPVDMILLRERSKEVAHALSAIGTVVSSGIGRDFFSKAILMASFRFFEMNAIDEGMGVLGLLDPDYVRNILPAQMDEDPAFREVATRIANILVEAGEVKPVYVLEEPTLVANRADA